MTYAALTNEVRAAEYLAELKRNAAEATDRAAEAVIPHIADLSFWNASIAVKDIIAYAREMRAAYDAARRMAAMFGVGS